MDSESLVAYWFVIGAWLFSLNFPKFCPKFLHKNKEKGPVQKLYSLTCCYAGRPSSDLETPILCGAFQEIPTADRSAFSSNSLRR